MKVWQLKKEIADLPDDMEIILQKDSEGNGYSPLDGVSLNGVYVPENTWSGKVYSMDLHHYDVCMTVAEWENIKRKERSLILYPIN